MITVLAASVWPDACKCVQTEEQPSECRATSEALILGARGSQSGRSENLILCNHLQCRSCECIRSVDNPPVTSVHCFQTEVQNYFPSEIVLFKNFQKFIYLSRSQYQIKSGEFHFFLSSLARTTLAIAVVRCVIIR